MLTIILILVGLLISLLLTYAFGASESVVFALSAEEIRGLSDRDDSTSRWLIEKLKHPREFSLYFVVAKTFFLTCLAVLLGIYSVHYLIPTFLSWWLIIIIDGVILWSVMILFKHAFPGNSARNRRLEKVIRWFPIIRYLFLVLFPLIHFWKAVLNVLIPQGGLGGQLAIERELDALLPDENDFASLETEEKEMIRHIVEFGETNVREVMVPRIDMVCIPAEFSPEEAVTTIAEAGHSRIPIYNERVDNIVGVLYSKDLLLAISKDDKPTDLRQIARTPYFVPEAKRISDLLAEFREERIHMAIVVDEYGGTAGLVTLEDLIEEIVGEIQDEYDEEEIPIKQLNENVYLVECKMPIDEVNESIGINLPEEESDTLGGFIYSLAKAIPKTGEQYEYENLILIVNSVVGQRVRNVKIIIRQEDQESE